MRGKVTPIGALKPHKIPKDDLRSVQSIYEKIEGRAERYELNLYISGEDEEEPLLGAAASSGADGEEQGSAPTPPASPEGSTTP